MIAGHDATSGDELTSSSARELATWIRTKKASAVEVLTAHLARIERVNPALNAIVTLDAERALARARDADRALARGESQGILHGVPFTLKDHHEVAGLPGSIGTRGSLRTPEADGVIAARLSASGAILLGKTNMAMALQTISEIHGRTSNPYDLARTAGGSSGGAAAAVAARLTSFDVGSDASGSIRLPAHFCGVFGLKTTLHRVPCVGLGLWPPGTPRPERVLGVTGPIARSLDDVALVLSALVGAHPADPDCPPVPLRPVPRVEAGNLRLALSAKLSGIAAQSEQTHAIERAAAALEQAGARVERCEPPFAFEELLSASRRYYPILATGLARAGLLPPARLLVPMHASAEDLHAVLEERARLSAKLERFLERFDAFVCPVSIGTAFPHCAPGSPIEIDGERVPSLCADHPCLLASYTGVPALSVPIGLDSAGLPIGMQLVGRRWHDAQLIGVAGAVADVLGPIAAPRIDARGPGA